MFTRFARSVTPRAVGVAVLLAATITAAVVATSGGHATSAAPARLGPAGTASTSGATSNSSVSAPSSGPIVSAAVHHDLSPPLRSLKPLVIPNGGPQLAPDAGGEGTQPKLPPGGPDPVIQSKFGDRKIPATSANFEGIFAGQQGPTYAPPDPNGTVGPNNYFEIANAAIGIYSKTGTQQKVVATNTLWQGFGGGCETNDDGDGTVVYDQFSGRWIVQQFVVRSLPYLECVLVSQTSDPLGAYYRYSFSYGNVDFPDYPKLGVWPDAFYVTYNIFANGQTFTGPEVCALDKAKMLQGLAATQQCFKQSSIYSSLLPATVDGPTPPPAGSPNYVVGLGPAGTNSLKFWKFHVDWNTPANSTLTGPTTINVAAFSTACGGGTCIPQPNTTQLLDSLGDRLMYRFAYRNFGDHESLVVAHSVVASGAVGMRWYELRNPNGTPTVFQQGTYAPDATYRWMGSIAMDHVGDMGLGFAVSSSTVRPGVRYTGRLVGDTLGQMTQGEGTLFTGIGSQTGNLSRWGDYTSMAVDPSDDCTFWYLGEYIPFDGSFNWHTRIGSFTFPSCTNTGNPPVVTSFTPASGPVGTNVSITGTGFTGATSVKFNGTAATTFTVNSDTSVNATVPNGATTGPISVTTPNGTGTSSTNFTVTTSGNPPVVTSFTPTSGPVGTNVSITGTGFTGATSVKFNATAATTFTVNSDTSINATVPNGATTGKISVTTPNGTGSSSTNFTVTVSTGCTDSWTNTAGGSWSVGSNWSLGTPPGSSDNACITLSGTYTVTFGGSATVRSLQVGATSGTQTLQLGSTCAQDAVLTSTNGDTVNARGILTLTNADTCAGNVTLDLTGGTLTNNGTVHVFGAIGGQRVVSGSVSNKKILMVDGGAALQVSGAFTQTGTGTFQPAITSATKLGTLTAGGAATLAGKVKLVKPFKSTTLGQSFTLLTAASRSGTFSQAVAVVLNASTGFYYLPTYSATAFSLVTTQATVSISPASGPAGSSVTVSGSGWPPGDKLTVSFRDHNSVTTNYPVVTVDGSGNFSVAETVPAAAAAGAGTFSARSPLVGLTLSKTFTVS